MKKQILFLQLPLLDNDVSAPRENHPFAALWLAHALAGHPEGRFWEVVPAPAEWDDLDNAHLIRAVAGSGAGAAAFTLYLWNVERSLRIARRLKEIRPDLVLIAGGPETAEDHPFLLEDPVFDALVTGEGETVFPEILRGIRHGNMPLFENVLLPVPGGWTRGRRSPPQADLAAVQVPVNMLKPCMEARPSVYVETSRGCPLTCTYCRYHHLQKGVRVLPAEAVARRIRELRAAGAREIRFVDPTFNSRADFTPLLERLAKLNAGRRLEFFAELRADTLTPEQARLLAEARFAEVEVGVQSTDPDVLRAIRRPANPARVEKGIRLLAGANVRVTLDLMYGLPEQTFDDVLRSIEWARGLGPGITIQCMQTLLLPGTDLRKQAGQYGIKAHELPPYGVVSTATMPEEDLRRIEALLQDSADLPADPETERFCGYRLRGLFPEQCSVDAARLADPSFAAPGLRNRRALLIRGGRLDAHRREICRLIGDAVRGEPDMLWQFVLCAEREEPLDLLRAMIAALRDQPPHLLDRYASAERFGWIASRRIFVRLKPGRRYDPAWTGQVEELLARAFL